MILWKSGLLNFLHGACRLAQEIDLWKDSDEAENVETPEGVTAAPGQGLNLTAAYQRRNNPSASC